MTKHSLLMAASILGTITPTHAIASDLGDLVNPTTSIVRCVRVVDPTTGKSIVVCSDAPSPQPQPPGPV